jgi:hypothetical protein
MTSSWKAALATVGVAAIVGVSAAWCSTKGNQSNGKGYLTLRLKSVRAQIKVM